ncbi:hypothetical protein KL905_000229 [Ogataea polymorpha]|nr:hypothetical protein KL908_001342 [Ogataea polymorpha]KAG7912680.1 hypothetical protein KL907_000882 [Ogataea polymorpha]KAG7924075.1 hypothetical protein KL905_000229 [Ogataea polymorpha]
MGRGARILDRAWARFTDTDRIAITDTGALIEEIEQIWGRALLSPDYKAFWIDTILEHPSRSLTKHEFLVLFKMLFEVEFEDLFDTDTDLTRRTDTRTIKRKAPAALSLVEQKQRLFQKISILKGTLNAQRKRSVDEDRTMELQLNRRLVDCYEALIQVYEQLAAEPADSALVLAVKRQDELLAQFKRKLNRTAKIKLWRSYLTLLVAGLLAFCIVSYAMGLIADLPETNDDDIAPTGYRRLPNRFFDSLNPIDRLFYSGLEWLGYV